MRKRARPRSVRPERRFSSRARLEVWFGIAGLLVSVPLYAAPQTTETPPAGQPRNETGKDAGADKVNVSIYGFMVVNMNYNTSGLFPGSQASFAIRPDVSESQFFISPQNSVLGINLRASPLEGAELLGALALTLRSPQPLITSNTISPQFYDVHLEGRTKTFHIAFGQMPDVVYPVTPDVLNGMPPGYLPGAIGYTRPQLQGGIDLPLSKVLHFLALGCLARPVNTFDVSDELVGRQAGIPDFQGRIAVGTGEAGEGGAAIRPRERPVEIGIDAHWGKRRFTIPQPTIQNFTFATWSVGGDLHVKLPSGTTLRSEIFVGSLLGDYQAGVFHTVDPTLLVAVRAWGFWGQISQTIGDRLRVGAAYGLDDPKSADLAPVTRGRNQAVLATGFWDISKRLGLGLEGSRWQTDFIGLPTSTAWRGDVGLYFGFGGS
jgi:hypothetical protein